MAIHNALEQIYEHPLLQDKEVEQICSSHKKIHFKKGEFLLKEGQISNEYYCLESGLIRAFATNSDGEEVTTGFFSANELVIEVASLFLQVPTKENIHTLSDCVCWKMDLDTFQRLFQTIPGLKEWGRDWMSGVLFSTKQRSLSMITDSATDRYLALQKEHPEIMRQAPLKYVASYLGITDTSLSRIRKEVSRRS